MAVQPGRSELEIWAEVRLAMERKAGERLPVAGDLTSGVANTGAISGWPGNRIVREHEPMLCDLGPRAGLLGRLLQHDLRRRAGRGLHEALHDDAAVDRGRSARRCARGSRRRSSTARSARSSRAPG